MQSEIMVAKHPAGTNRLTRIVNFVDAHFDRDTGEPVSGGFFEVLNRLGRTDLDFGAELRELGALDASEREYAKAMYTERRRAAINPEKRVFFESKPLWSDLRANPFYRQMSSLDRMVFEALDSTGMLVVNPAAATTLAQAVLENWFDVPLLLLSPSAILSQASEQGDSHASYLLATAHLQTGQPLLDAEAIRKDNLDHANRLGHVGARNAIAEAGNVDQMESALRDEMDDEIDERNFSAWVKGNVDAERDAPNSSGDRLLEIAEALDESLLTLFLFGNPKCPDIAVYKEQISTTDAWIERAAIESARARHVLAMRAKGETIGERIEMLKRAATPESGVSPYFPALIDLAELYAQPVNSVSDSKLASHSLGLALERIPVHDSVNWIRMLDLVEALDESASPKVLYGHYTKYVESSAYAAFRSGLFALRACASEQEFQKSASHFRTCMQFSSKEYLDERDKTSLVFAEVALNIGWGEWDAFDWDKAVFSLVSWLHESNYQHHARNLWLSEGDIQKLFEWNPAYQRYMSANGEKLIHSDIKVRRAVTRGSEIRHPGIGEAAPLAYIQGIVAIAFNLNLSDVQLQRDYEMNRESMVPAFLFGQLCLSHRFGMNRRAEAATHFEQAWRRVKLLQSTWGGEGIGFEGKTFRWLESLTHVGLMQSQPNVRHMDIRDELNGPAHEFGTKLLAQIFVALGLAKCPTISPVVAVKYNDSYLYKPMAIALLASFFGALKAHFEAMKQWRVENVGITTATSYTNKEKKDLTPGYGFNAPWVALEDRDQALHTALSVFGIGINLETKFVRHERLLRILFEDGSELKVWIDKGMTSWKAVPGGEEWVESFDFRNTPDEQGKALAHTRVAVGPSRTRAACNPGDFFIPCSVEWRSGSTDKRSTR